MLRITLVLFACCVSAHLAFGGESLPYDPLVPLKTDPATELRVSVVGDQGRDIPIRILVPAGEGACPMVFFSHGLGGSCEGNDHFAHWAARGYVVVYLQHPGSDVGVWQDVPAHKRLESMQAAASAKNFALRVADVRSVLDQVEAWIKQSDHVLCGRVDVERIGMSGHSFGAITTQAVSGQQYGKLKLADARIRAAIAFSPSIPRMGDVALAFGHVRIPWLLMTGTHDNSIIGDQDPAARRQVFPALPAGHAYELVLDRAEHSVFTDRALPGEHLPRDPRHHRAIIAISTAFWDAYLRGDAQAQAWLNGEDPRSVLIAADAWQHK